jgi:hypothetical protein
MRLARFTPVLLVLALSACDKASNEGGDFEGGVGTKAVTIFDPVAASPQFPFPVDLLFGGFTDPTLNIPNPTGNPAVAAVNELDGWSTTASLFTDLTGFVDFATVPAGLVIIDTSTGTRLVAGTDFTVQSSTAIDTAAPPGPINTKRSRILIEPLKPFKPSTRYLVAVTTAVKSTAGEPIIAGDLFRVVRSSTPVAEQTEPALTLLNDTQKATLEVIRQQFQPMIQAFGAAGLPAENIAIAWPFTTQSSKLTLQRMAAAATAAPLTLFPTGLDISQVVSSLPPVADIYAGQLVLPYYLAAPSEEAPTAPLTQFWKADISKPNLDATFLGQVPCGAFAAGAPLPTGTAKPSNSTTLCYPLPLKQSDQTVPVIVTIPKGTMPEAGWPVVIFQHGITGNRSQMLPLSPALTQAGFAVIAIDLPLHGAAATGSEAALRVPGTTERTFDLDLVNNTTSAPGPDGSIDGSGTHFINLASLATSRDNLRQGVSDLLVLGQSLSARDGSGNGAVFVVPPGVPGAGTVLPIRFDTTQVRYVGHSLGAIVANTFLGVNSQTGAGVLAMPGGGIAKLLDASAAFGPRISAGLAGGGVTEGTDNYETFLRFAQTLVDSGDPLNFAAEATAAHPLFMIEVVGDAVVPNCALRGDPLCPATDTITLSGFLSGTTPLARLLGLTFRPGPGEGEALTLPTTANVLVGAAARSNVVRFAQGDHGSILSPAASAEATTEMQKLTASFLRSNGTCLPIGGACPAPAAD